MKERPKADTFKLDGKKRNLYRVKAQMKPMSRSRNLRWLVVIDNIVDYTNKWESGKVVKHDYQERYRSVAATEFTPINKYKHLI